jgi:hypothetical protein
VCDGINIKFKQRLTGNWYSDRRFTKLDSMFNSCKSSVTCNLSIGMKYWWTPSVVFLIKSICSLGFKVNDEDIIRYHCRDR